MIADKIDLSDDKLMILRKKHAKHCNVHRLNEKPLNWPLKIYRISIMFTIPDSYLLKL